MSLRNCVSEKKEIHTYLGKEVRLVHFTLFCTKEMSMYVASVALVLLGNFSNSTMCLEERIKQEMLYM